MTADSPGLWIRLDIVRASGRLRVDAHAGPDLEPEMPQPEIAHSEVVEPALDLFGQAIMIPRATFSAVARGAEIVGSGPVRILPVFVAPRRGIRTYPWEQALHDVLASRVPPTSFELIRLVHSQGPPAPHADMPIRVLAAGPLAGAAVRELASYQWLDDPIIRRHGLALSVTKESRIERELRDRRPAVVITSSRALPAILRWARGRPRSPHHELRLVVAIEDGTVWRPVDQIPDGTSVISVDSTRGRGVIADLVFGLVHDRPLHEVVKDLRARGGFAWLQAHPRSVHALRLEPMLRRTIDLQRTAREQLARVDHLGAPAINAVVGEDLRLDFAREIDGFAQGAHARARLAAIPARRRAGSGSRTLEGIFHGVPRTGSTRAAAAVERRPRTVDLQLESTDLRGAAEPWISPHSTLRVHARYRLCFAIGLALPGSLFDRPPPSIDAVLPALPEGQDRELEVAVYGHGFTILGAVVRKLRLPAVGPSSHLRFELRPHALGTARVRVVVYHENQAIQSFLVTCLVTASEDHVQAASTARLVFSRSPEFANLARMRPRIACIGVNHTDTEITTHTFMLKGKGADSPSVNIPQSLLSSQMQQLRTRLYAATFSGSMPRFPMDGGAPDVQRVEFRSVIQQLAEDGRKLYQMLAQRARDRDKLKVIRDSANGTIQVVRYDLGYSFPWAILYDFALPARKLGDPLPAVCVDPNCQHSISIPGYCIRGFWGIRHVIEELLAAGERDEVDSVVPPGPGRGVAISLGLDDEFGRGLDAEVGEFAGAAAVSHVTGAKAILDMLWDDKQRPAQLIVYSHLETRNLANQPFGPRFVFAADKSTLRPDDIFDRWEASDHEWGDPRTVVFLMGCNSAAIDDSLLGGFAEKLHSAGAMAIVGTEAPAFAALVSEFARKVGRAWWSGKVTLGEAVRRYRIELLNRGNPLGFVFTALGKSDLRVSRGGNA